MSCSALVLVRYINGRDTKFRQLLLTAAGIMIATHAARFRGRHFDHD
jgi:hypothetical protein